MGHPEGLGEGIEDHQQKRYFRCLERGKEAGHFKIDSCLRGNDENKVK